MRQFVEIELVGRQISDVEITSEITMLGAIQELRNAMEVGSVWISTDQCYEVERFNVISIRRGCCVNNF